MTDTELKRGDRCQFRNQPERLVYIGYNKSGLGYWHQFEREGIQGVWCEITETELHLIERTPSEPDGDCGCEELGSECPSCEVEQ